MSADSASPGRRQPPAPTEPGLGAPAQHLAMIFDSARDMMMLAKVAPGELFRVVSVNRPYVETIRAAGFNLTAADFEGRSFAEVRALFGFDAATTAEIQARYEQVIRTGRLLEYDEVTRTPAGVFHGRTTITPILDDAGACTYVLYSSQDVTARVRAEQARRESEEKFVTVFREAPVWIVISDANTSVCLEVNDAALQASGYRREEVVGRTGAELGWIRAEDRTRLVQTMKEQGRVVDMEMQFHAKDGRVLSGLVSCAPIVIDGRACTLSVTIDITARKQTEAALHESEEKFAKAFRASPDAISVHELETGRYVDVNEGFLRLFGYTREDVLGRTPAELGFWKEEANRRDFVEQLRRDGRVRHFNVKVRLRDGRIRECQLSSERIELGGRPHNVTILHDITERLQAERALLASEDKFARAFRASPDAISISEVASGRILEVNEGFERLSGFNRAELIGRTVAELGLWVEPGAREQMAAELARTGAVHNLQMRLRNRHGDQGDFLVSGEIVDIGGVSCLVAVSRDITERLQAERALRDSEQKFAVAFRVSPDFISISEYESGRYLEVNDAHTAFFGYSREELIGRSPQELGIVTSLEPREGILRLLERDGYVRAMKVPARTRAGRDVVISLSAETVMLNGRKCILRHSHDVTAQLQAERALRESEEMFAKAFRSSPQALIITEIPSGQYIDVNVGFERITGYRREEIIGRTSAEIGIWDNPADRDDLMQRMQRDGWARDVEYVFRGQGGKRLVTRCSFELVDISGRKCLLSVIEDITERRQAEEQKAVLEAQLRQNQKLEALGTLAGGIAHDFNNILTAIIVNQELALMDLADPAEVRGRLEEIGQASNRAKDLVRQILTFSRQQQHERLRQHLQMIVREALSLLRASLPATIEIKLDLSPDAPPVLADASQVHQVVMNLCTNSAHAMQAGGGRLTVRLAPRWLDEAACRGLPGLRPGSYAQLTVIDTGHGMDAGVLARIFEPFFTTKGPGEGTGLGLPMVHGIMQDHGGGIFVQSTPGAGTTFDLYFPEATGIDSRAPHAESGIEPGRGETVLIVDDEEAICAAIGAMLRKIGYHTEVFTNPVTALERFRSAPTKFSLLLTDRTMPHLTGPALIAEARAWWPGLPAVLMSGLSSPLPAEVAAEPGYELVAKPIEIAELSRVVRRALTPSPPS